MALRAPTSLTQVTPQLLNLSTAPTPHSLTQTPLIDSPLQSLPPLNSLTPTPHSHSQPHCPRLHRLPLAQFQDSPLLHSVQTYLHSYQPPALRALLQALQAAAPRAPTSLTQVMLQSLNLSTAPTLHSLIQTPLIDSPLQSLPPLNFLTPPLHPHSHSQSHCPRPHRLPLAQFQDSPLLHSVQTYLHSYQPPALRALLQALQVVALRAPTSLTQVTPQLLNLSTAPTPHSLTQTPLIDSPLQSLPPLNSLTPTPHSHSQPHCPRLHRLPLAQFQDSPLLHSVQTYLHSYQPPALRALLQALQAAAPRAPTSLTQVMLQSLNLSTAPTLHSLIQTPLIDSPLQSLPPLNSQTPPLHSHSHSQPHCPQH